MFIVIYQFMPSMDLGPIFISAPSVTYVLSDDPLPADFEPLPLDKVPR
jgi:hypothetical protein